MLSHPLLAKKWWNDTGLDVVAGQIYIVAPVEPYAVDDAGISVDGLRGCQESKRHELFDRVAPWIKRVPTAPYFALVVAVDRDDLFTVAPDGHYRAPTTGRLWAYFNDAFFAYGNNHGQAQITLTLKP